MRSNARKTNEQSITYFGVYGKQHVKRDTYKTTIKTQN